MRKIPAFISILLAAAMLSGCYPDGAVSQVLQEQSTDEPFDPHVQARYGEVTLDYIIPDEYPTEVPKITITKKDSWDREKLVPFFLGDQPYELSTPPKCAVEYHYFVRGNTRRHNKTLSLDKGYLKYINGEHYYNEYMQGSIGSTYIPLRHYASDEQLSFPSDDAIERTNLYLEALGITNYSEPLVIPISKERADRVYEDTGGGLNYATLPDEGGEIAPGVPWTEEQEFYVLIYQLEYNGIKVNDGSIRFNGMGGNSG